MAEYLASTRLTLPSRMVAGILNAMELMAAAVSPQKRAAVEEAKAAAAAKLHIRYMLGLRHGALLAKGEAFDMPDMAGDAPDGA